MAQKFISHARNLKKQLEEKLKKAETRFDNNYSKDFLEEALVFTTSCLGKLRYTYYTKGLCDPDFNTEAQIEFFKSIKPTCVALYLFYHKVYNWLVNQPVGGASVKEAYIRKNHELTTEFLQFNQQLYSYYHNNNDELDKVYFTIQTSGKINQFRLPVDEPDYSTGWDMKLADIMANEKFLAFLELEQKKLLNPSNIVNVGNETSKLIWSDSKVNLVELIYALHSSKAINNGKASLATIAESFEQLFGIDLDGYRRKFMDIKIRKTGTTNFLDELKNNLQKKIEQDDY